MKRMIEVTEVKIYPFEMGDDSYNVKAYADVTLAGCLTIRGVRVMETRHGGLSSAFPRSGAGATVSSGTWWCRRARSSNPTCATRWLPFIRSLSAGSRRANAMRWREMGSEKPFLAGPYGYRRKDAKDAKKKRGGNG